MGLDPQTAALLELIDAVPPMHEGAPEAARTAFRQLTVEMRQHVVPVESVSEATVPGPAGDIPIRVYRPASPRATVVFFHGGGWVIGDLDTHDNTCRTLASTCSATVVAVDYRLAPEAPFPAAVDDALAATKWAVAEHGPVAVAGDSAGGNLAAVVAQALVDDIAAQLLIYPSVDVPGDYESRTVNGSGYFLDVPTMEWFRGHYVPDESAHLDPRVSPLRGRLTGLPPAVVVTAEYDPLRDEGEAYAAAMAAAGVRVVHRRYDGLVHGFFDMGAWSQAAQAAVEDTCRLFSELLDG